MRHHLRLVLTLVAGAFVLAHAVGTAAARRLEISNTGIRIVWARLTFTGAAEGGPAAICPVTLEGTLHSRTFSKVLTSLIGYITRAAVTRASCSFTGGAEGLTLLTAREELSLPWHVEYDFFLGVLPSITGVRLFIVGWAWLITEFAATCLYRSGVASPAIDTAGVNGAGTITGMTAEGEAWIPKFSGGILCASNARMNGTGAVTVLGSTAGITLRLVG